MFLNFKIFITKPRSIKNKSVLVDSRRLVDNHVVLSYLYQLAVFVRSSIFPWILYFSHASLAHISYFYKNSACLIRSFNYFTFLFKDLKMFSLFKFLLSHGFNYPPTIWNAQKLWRYLKITKHPLNTLLLVLLNVGKAYLFLLLKNCK